MFFKALKNFNNVIFNSSNKLIFSEEEFHTKIYV